MKVYFLLQFKMANRKWHDFGLHPAVGFFLLIIGFIIASVYLFSKTEFAQSLYVFVALGLTSKMSELNRNDFLKHCFKTSAYYKLRLLENAIVASPFIAFLIYKQMFLGAIALTTLALLMALINTHRNTSFTTPTPFHKRPFEFLVGFRNTFFLVFGAYFLTFMSISVGNFNLGVFALLLVFALSLSFYSKPENEYYVWIFKDKPNSFLLRKIKTGLYYSTILSLPILLALIIFFSKETYTLLMFLLLAYVYLGSIILAKYAAYPNEINMPQAILIGLSLLFPPMLLAIIPFFYMQSVKRLNDLLK
ncbi:MAG: ABC transporter permease [Bacteroidetes bacterium 4572_77]|nr:MAG: ABC transporter permease [Bacteroidetes bacterium 4572_77]